MKSGRFSAVVGIVLAVVFIAPTVIVIGSSFSDGSFIVFPPKGFTFDWYRLVLADPDWLAAFRNSALVGILAAAIAVVLGVLLALGAVRARLIPPALVTALAVMPIIIPTVIAGLGFYIVAVRLHLTGSVMGLAFAHGAIGVPYVFAGVLAAMSGLDGSLEEAARVAGARPFGAFVRVVVPVLTPAIASGALLAFLSSWDEVVIASFLTTPTFTTLPVELFSTISSGATPAASAVATLVTCVPFVLIGVGAATLGVIRRGTRSGRK